MKKLLLLSIAFLLFTTGCHKKEEDPSKEEILTQSPWTGEKITINFTDGTTTTENRDQEKLVFHTDYTYKKYIYNQLQDQGEWSFNEETYHLIFNSDSGETTDTEVKTLEADKLELEYRKDMDGDGQKDQVKVSYRRE